MSTDTDRMFPCSNVKAPMVIVDTGASVGGDRFKGITKRDKVDCSAKKMENGDMRIDVSDVADSLEKVPLLLLLMMLTN